MDYERAVAALYQAPLGEFVETRKRLAAEVKVGDKDGAKKLLKLGRPPISAWAVNQLYWHARDAFDAFMATAARLREGDLGASGAHREALARLRQRAATIIGDAGHNANEAVLRRTTQTLSAIAAIGSFAPDPPGALAEDRDPPGFEAVSGLEGALATSLPKAPAAAPPAPAKPAANSLEAILAASLGKPAPAAEEEEEGVEDDASDEDLAALAELQQASVRSADKNVRSADVAPPSTDKIADLVRTLATGRKAEPPVEANPPVEAKRPRHLSSVPMPDDDDEARIAASRQRAADAAEREERERIARVRQEAAERAEREERERIANEKSEKAKARERERIEKAIATARRALELKQREVESARHQLALAEGRANDANDELAELERELENL